MSSPSACQACGGLVSASLPGLLRCCACGLACRAEKFFAAPAYAPGREGLVYGSSKKKLFAAALDSLGAGAGRLLDIGCAGGEFLAAAAARGWIAEGVEIEPGLAARAAGAGFEVHTVPVEKAGLPPRTFDAVTAFEVFSQMAAPAAAAAEAARLLKPGGRLYLREFNADFHLPLYRLELRGFFKPLGARPSVIHDFNFTPSALRALLLRAGFAEVSIRNSRPTSGDPYGSGGGLGTFFTAALKVLYYVLAQALWLATLGRVYAGSALIVTARKPG